MTRLVVCAALALIVLVLPATASAGRARTTECPQEFCAGVSADGSRVVFPFADELTVGAGTPQVYEWFAGRPHPLVTLPEGARRLPAIGFDGISSDARHVFVETSLGLVPTDVDGGWDIYDVGGGVPVLVSTGPLDAARGGASFASFTGASADGSRVFFSSLTPMVAGDTSPCGGLYERANGVTGQVAIGPNPTLPLGPNQCYTRDYDGLSADGTHLYFTTDEDLLGEGKWGKDIYQRVGSSLAVLTTYPDSATTCVDIPRFGAASADGATVLFSTNTPISPEDTDQAFDVYKREPDGSFVLVSRGTDGGPDCGFGGDRPIALSADGTIAIFETRAQLSAADHDSSNDLYRAQDGAPPLLLSTGPTDLGVDEKSQVFPDWVTDVSADARNVAFETKAPLVADDHDRSMDAYVNVDGTTELASTGPVQGSAGAAAELLGLSDDGQTVVFATKGRMTNADRDRDRDIYLRRLGPEKTILVSAEAIPPQMRVARTGRLLASGSAMVRVACPKTETSGPCRGTVTLSRGKKRLGRAPFRIDSGGRQQVAVKLPKSLSASAPIRLLARVRGDDQIGNSRVMTRRVRLMPPRRRGA